MTRKTYEQRLEGCVQPLMKKLFGIIIEKKSNLCVAANFDTFDEILEFVDKAGKHICMLKIQLNRLARDGRDNHAKLELLYQKKKEYNFLLFEDPKYHDDENTVRDYYRHVVKFCDLVTIHPYGDGIFRAIDSVVHEANLPSDEPRACLSVCEISFKHNTCLDPKIALENSERNFTICAGVIAQTLQVTDPMSMIKLSPGVHLRKTSDGGSQQWNPPSKLINQGADVLIVGRGIVSGPKDKLELLTMEYKEACYKAYIDSTKD